MSKHVYISADYDANSGDRNVVEELYRWNDSQRHKIEFTDMASVVSGSVVQTNPDCRACDIKAEFNRQINASSAVIFVVGDKTKDRVAGSNCERCDKSQYECTCTPYKKNVSGARYCKVPTTYDVGDNDDFGCINNLSYLRHEFEQARKKGKQIIVVYNSQYKRESWLPSYLYAYKDEAVPFWVKTDAGNVIGNYDFIKKAFGYE